MSPRQPQGNSDMREVMAMLSGLSEKVDGAARDAREARDASIELRATHRSENVAEQVAKIVARQSAAEIESRADLQNAIQRLDAKQTAEIAKASSAVDANRVRIEELEAWRERIEGAHGVLGWVSKYMPWILSAAIGALALIGKKVGAP